MMVNKKVTLFIWLTCLLPCSAFSQVYRCEINGQPVYQSGSCQNPQAEDMRILDIPVSKSTAMEDLGKPTEIMTYHNAQPINIEKDCREKYSDNTRMYRYCINDERNARNNVDRLRKAPNEILNYCYDKWDTWSMRENCIRREVDARDNVFKLALKILPDLRRRCMSEWDTWSMREYCMQK
jgi:hypothetical protein